MANQIDTDAKSQSENDEGFGQQHVIRKSDGTLYAVQINDLNEIEVHTSLNAGITWSLDTTFSSLTNPQHLSLAKSELDDIFLCFNSGSSDIIVKKKDNGTGVWTEILVQNQVTSGSYIPYGLITYNKIINRLHLVWVSNYQFTINEKHTDDKGDNWSTKVGSLSNSGGVDVLALYGLDFHPSTGSLYAHYLYKNWVNYRTEILNSDGVRTGYEARLTSSQLQLGGGLSVDSVGNRWKFVYWQIQSSNLYKLQVWKNDSVSLTIHDAVDDAFKRGMFSIGIDGADNVYIFYVKESDGKCYFRMYTESTETWGSETIFTASGDGLRPSCEQHSLFLDNKLHTVFYTA